jgi:cell division protein FtsL
MATTSVARPRFDQGAQAKQRPELALVPRRRRFVGVALTFVTVVVATMMAVTVFHTRLAERQYQLDVIEREVATERARFDLLRRERAWMASPERLADRAKELGLVSGGRTEFLDVPAEVLAVVTASTAGLDPQVARPPRTPLDDFRIIKHVLQVQP